MTKKTKAISLFSSSGIGDLAFKRLGVDVLVANELIQERCDLFELNFPDTELIRGSILDNKDIIINETLSRLENKKLDFALVTPPCQGMSKNGRGKLLAEIRAGRRSNIDQRNLLIIPSLEVIKSVNPETIVFENVPEMQNTVIPYKNDVISILDLIKTELSDWHVEAKVVEFANYGIPQRRQRLITVATKNKKNIKRIAEEGTLFPKETHSIKESLFTEKWVTVRDVIGKFEPLCGFNKPKSENNELHYVPRLDEDKYFWVSNTPKGKSAFDNQCISCGDKNQLTHTAKKNEHGINRSSRETPIFCSECNALLPRPFVRKGDSIRLMKGFTSAYKRMDWDSPSSAITRNFPYVCSDNKIHPSQHRSLSVYEALILHSIKDGEYKFVFENGRKAGMTAIRDTLGESIPPKFLEILFSHLLS